MNTHDKKGNPTAYGFACGYVQEETMNENRKELYKEGGVYHIKIIRNSKIITYSHEQLTWARKIFNNLIIY